MCENTGRNFDSYGMSGSPCFINSTLAGVYFAEGDATIKRSENSTPVNISVLQYVPIHVVHQLLKAYCG